MQNESKHVQVVAALIQNENRYLMTQRKEKAIFPLHWEFPGGKVLESETCEAALQRELKYRLGVDSTIGECISTTEHHYPHFSVKLHLYACSFPPQANLQAHHVETYQWVTATEMKKLKCVPADEKSILALLEETHI